MTRLDFSSTVDVISAWPPIITPTSSSPAKANGSDPVERADRRALVAFCHRHRRRPVDAHDRVQVCRGPDVSRPHPRVDNRLAQALVDRVLDPIVEVGRHVQVVGAVLVRPRERRPRPDARPRARDDARLGWSSVSHSFAGAGLRIAGRPRLHELKFGNRAPRRHRSPRWTESRRRAPASSRTPAGALASARRVSPLAAPSSPGRRSRPQLARDRAGRIDRPPSGPAPGRSAGPSGAGPSAKTTASSAGITSTPTMKPLRQRRWRGIHAPAM